MRLAAEAKSTLTDFRTELHFPSQPTDPIVFEMRCFAPYEHDWSFSQFYAPDAIKRESYSKAVCKKFAGMNLRTVIAPRPSFNAEFGLRDSFTEELVLECGVTIKRPALKIEAAEIFVPEGGAFTAGGCPCAVLICTDRCGRIRIFFAHAGTGSLIDLEHAVHHNAARTNYSVIDALIDYAIAEGAQPKWMTLRCFFSIPWRAHQYSTKDPVHGESNEILFDHLRKKYRQDDFIKMHDGHEHMDLESLIEIQAHRRGIERVSSHCTLPERGYFAHTRHIVPELSGAVRNLVVITVC